MDKKQKNTVRDLFEAQKKNSKDLKTKKKATLEAIKSRFSQVEEKTMKAIAKEAGIDFENLQKIHEKQYCNEFRKVREEINKAKKEYSSHLTRKKRVYDQAFEKYMRAGFKELHEKFHHNPTLRAKMAQAWSTDINDTGGHDPREGLSSVPGARAGAGIVTVEGPGEAQYTNELHPYVIADVGIDEKFGHASASVKIILNFELPAPRNSMYIWEEYLALRLQGWGSANSSDGWFVSQTNALESGGRALMNMSLKVLQAVHRRDLHDDFTFDIASDQIAQFYSTGAIWFPLFFPVPLQDLPVWGEAEMDHWTIYNQPFVLYNETSGGGPVRIELEFELEADAKNINSASQIRFDESGQTIKINEIGLRGTEL